MSHHVHGPEALDQVLAARSAESTEALLRAALDSPSCARIRDPLLFAWARVLEAPTRQGSTVGAEDLPELLHAVFGAAPGWDVVIGRAPNTVAQDVRFAYTGRQFRVHPGELDHPLMVLRALRDAAEAVDAHLAPAAGFGIGSILELALHHMDHVGASVERALPEGPGRCPDTEEIWTGITPAEVSAAARTGIEHLHTTVEGRPQQKAALTYLTRDLAAIPRTPAGVPVLGPTLVVTTPGGRAWPVPASAAVAAATAVTEDLLRAHPAPDDVQDLLLRTTASRLQSLLPFHRPADSSGRVLRFSVPAHRLQIALAATLHDNLRPLLDEARDVLDTAPAGSARIIVYAGPRFLGRQLITGPLCVHIEELTEILQAAGGDWMTVALWALELTEHPGADAVAFYDVLDAWTRWSATGTLIPPGPAQDGVILVEPCGRDVSWERATVLARIDAVLAAAGLPPSIDWASISLYEALQGAGEWADLVVADVGTEVRACVSTHPPLVVLATVNPDTTALLDGPTFAELADGIRGTLAGSLDLTRHFTLPTGRPVRLQLHETTQAHQPPGAPEELPQDILPVGTTMDEDTAQIGIILDPPFLARFTHDGHRLLGLVLHHTSTRIRDTHQADPGLGVQEFQQEWNSVIPVMTWHAADPAEPRPAPPVPTERSLHLLAHVMRRAADAVRTAGVPAGTFAGGEALRPGGPAEQLLRALENELEEQVRAQGPGLLPALVAWLNGVLSARSHQRHKTLAGVAREDELWRQAAQRNESEGGILTNALFLVIQQALRTPPAADRPVDLVALAELAALAELLLNAALVAVPASRRLHPVHLTIHGTGVFTLSGTAVPPAEEARTDLGFDVEAFRRAQEHAWLARAESPEPATPEQIFASPVPVDFTPLAPAPGSSLARADRELLVAWGCGFDALAAVLATAADQPLRADGLAFTTAAQLARDAASWSDLPEEQTTAAIEHLLLPADSTGEEHDHAYTEVERRIRPTTHPLIPCTDGILIAPWLIHTAQRLYAVALSDGRLPRPDAPLKVTQLLDRHRQQYSNQLEKDLAAAAQQAGLHFRANLDVTPAARAGIPGLPGEIDLLVADTERGRLWVVEAKNPHGAIGIHHRESHLRKFIRYRDKLLTKAVVIEEHAAAAARACGIDAPHKWRVVPLFVTPAVDPAAFVEDPGIAFTSIADLVALLVSPADPESGWNALAMPAVNGEVTGAVSPDVERPRTR
ncbi:hypothetical protein [Streptomyces litmocidini]|uniref:hypothetical protein n=1 Tax=Streptomyces litmocidini TaxID=67318 RepID=UPI0036FEF644